MKSERHLRRTRRRWRQATLALLLLLAAFPAYYMVSTTQAERIEAMPTWLLVRLAPVDENAWVMGPFGQREPVSPMLTELVERAKRPPAENPLKPAHWRTYLSRIERAQPDRFDDILVVRDTWARDAPVEVGFKYKDLMGAIGLSRLPFVIRARIEGSDGPWIMSSSLSDDFQFENLGHPTGATSRSIVVEVCLVKVTDPSPSGGRHWSQIDMTALNCIWRGEFDGFKVVDRAEEVLKPSNDPRIAEHIRIVEPSCVINDGEPRLWWPSSPPFPDDLDVSLGVEVELRCNGLAVAEGIARLDTDTLGSRMHCYAPLQWTHGPVAVDEDASWRLLFRGSATASMGPRPMRGSLFVQTDTLPGCYWSGELELPAQVEEH